MSDYFKLVVSTNQALNNSISLTFAKYLQHQQQITCNSSARHNARGSGIKLSTTREQIILINDVSYTCDVFVSRLHTNYPDV